MYTLYEYKVDDLKVGVILSDTEQLLYIGGTLYSARTNLSPDKKKLNSDITGRGLVSVELEPFEVIINGEHAEPIHTYEAAEKYDIIQYWNSRLK